MKINARTALLKHSQLKAPLLKWRSDYLEAFDSCHAFLGHDFILDGWNISARVGFRRLDLVADRRRRLVAVSG